MFAYVCVRGFVMVLFIHVNMAVVESSKSGRCVKRDHVQNLSCSIENRKKTFSIQTDELYCVSVNIRSS